VKKLYILVEGQTELAFVKNVLWDRYGQIKAEMPAL